MKILEGKTIKKVETIAPNAVKFEFTDGYSMVLKCISPLSFITKDTNMKMDISPDTDEDYQWRMMVE